MKKIQFILFLLFTSQIVCFAQTDCLHFVEEENIISITDDAEFIWVGTEENGLVRINKSTFEKTVFNNDNTNLPVNFIKSTASFNNQVFVSTDEEILVYGGEDFYTFSSEVSGLFLNLTDDQLAVADNAEFRIFDADGSTIYTKDLFEVMPNQCCPHITDIEQDADGNIWLSHWDFYQFAVMKFDGTEWTAYNSQNSVLPIEAPENTNAITVIDNRVFATAWSVLYEYNAGVWEIAHSSEMQTIQNDEDNIVDYALFSIEGDDSNILWIGANRYVDNQSYNKIAYQIDNEWYFLDVTELDLQRINVIKKSQTNSDFVYFGTLGGLVIVDKNCLEIVSSNKHQIVTNTITVFPNPTTSSLKLKMKNIGLSEFELSDISGRKVQSGFADNDTFISMQNLPNGVYYLTLKNDTDYLITKVIKQDSN